MLVQSLLASVVLSDTITIDLDNRFEDFDTVKRLATETKSKIKTGDIVLLEAKELPTNLDKFTADGYPPALQRFLVSPLLFQDQLNQKVELKLPLAKLEVTNAAACLKEKCIDELLENGPSVFNKISSSNIGLAGRVAILSNAFRVRLTDDDNVHAMEIGKDAEEEGPHRTWGKLAETIQKAGRTWKDRGIPATPDMGRDHTDESWFSGWFVKLGLFFGVVPMIVWGVIYGSNFLTKSKPIAAPLLGDIRLEECDGIEPPAFQGRKITEYSHLNV